MSDLQNHWTDLPEWNSGRQLWAFYLTFPRCELLHARVARYHEALHGVGGLDLVKPEFLHLTVQGIAFADRITPSQLNEIWDAAQYCAENTWITNLAVHDALPDFDAIQMDVSPADPIVTLKAELSDRVAEIIGGSAVYELPGPKAGFRPHISIAYANQDVSGSAVLKDLAELNCIDIRIPATSLSLIKLCRGRRMWYWSDEYRFPFGSAGMRGVHSESVALGAVPSAAPAPSF
jgi:hypothetical protein